MFTFLSGFLDEEPDAAPEVMVKAEGRWQPLDEALADALRSFARQLRDAQVVHRYDMETQALVGVTYPAESYCLQIRTNELEEPTATHVCEADTPTTLVAVGKHGGVAPFALWLPVQARYDQSAIAVLREVGAQNAP